MSIQKILIANRGEIACRIIRTCQEMGIATVAVYSEPDADALHVEMADEAYHIGPAAAAESYLVVKKILDVAKQSGADAIHPGYGFLSENADFADACEKAGVIFIGPPASSIRAMGGKSDAKALMEKAKVPLVPGYHGDKQDADFLAKEADKIGYPVLIKASAGGGGKGMRVVEKPADFAEALAGAKREGKASFGNDHVLIEKYLVNPRHVEIQVFADQKGNIVYLFERDCSIQRRHQKVLEEAPAPGLSEKTREKMGQAAVNVAKAIGYVGAGTVEFLLDTDESFYFMEMNTRLQVEHPVTECITGLDLVALQIFVAEGEPLSFGQKDLAINGHAIEVRLYAEDPENNFLPGAGQLQFLRFPMSNENVRVDTGVREAPYGDGDVISIHYDPMIAKIIVWGENRNQAILNMADALDTMMVAGPKTNLNFLRSLCRHKAFIKGKLTTSFISDHEKDLLPQGDVKLSDETLALATLGLLKDRENKQLSYHAGAHDMSSPWTDMSSWRIGGSDVETFVFKKGEAEYHVQVSTPDGIEYPILSLPNGGRLDGYYEPSSHDMSFYAELDDRHYNVVMLRDGKNVRVMQYGATDDFIYLDPLAFDDADSEGDAKLTAPMPGKVVAIRVQLGSEVKKGEPLIIVEAMKMEHTIVAPTDGIIASINANVGDQVDEKLELIAFQ